MDRNRAESPAQPKPKRELLRDVLMIFFVAFLVAAVALMFYVGRLENTVDSMHQQLAQLQTAMDDRVAELQEENNTLQDQLGQMERRAMAGELLALALEAIAREDQVAFNSYMAVLEAYADTLEGSAAALYGVLEDQL